MLDWIRREVEDWDPAWSADGSKIFAKSDTGRFPKEGEVTGLIKG